MSFLKAVGHTIGLIAVILVLDWLTGSVTSYAGVAFCVGFSALVRSYDR